MTETPVSLDDIAALSMLANGVMPPDSRDAGAAAVHAGAGLAERMRHGANGALYVEGLSAAAGFAREKFERGVSELSAVEMSELLGVLAESSAAFFRQLRADV